MKLATKIRIASLATLLYISLFPCTSSCEDQVVASRTEKKDSSSRTVRSNAAYFEDLTNPVHGNSLEVLNRNIHLHPEMAMNYVYRGAAYLKDGDAINALADFKKALTVQPNCADAHVGISRVCEVEKKYPGVFFELEQALRFGTPSAKTKILWEEAFLHREIREYDKSLLMYTRLINQKEMLPSDKAYAIFQRGEIYLRTAKNQAAINDFTSAIKLDSRLLVARSTRAASYLALHKTKEALADFDAIIAFGSQHEPDDVYNDLPSPLLLETYKNRANLYKRLGKSALEKVDRETIQKLNKQVFESMPFRTRMGN